MVDTNSIEGIAQEEADLDLVGLDNGNQECTHG
jgi:hypothetical protein